MASPTTRTQNAWETQNGNDFLQLINNTGTVLGGIDVTGTPFGALAAGGGGSSAFSSLTSGTNTTAAMVVGTGGSLTVSGSGTINATTLESATFASPGAVGGTTPAAGTFTTLTGQTSVTAGVVGTTAGVINLSGSTTGTATITAPAIAGTSTNAIVFSNVIKVAAGSAASCGLQFPDGANYGLFDGGGNIVAVANGQDAFAWRAGFILAQPSQGIHAWTSASGDPTATLDTGLTRVSAGVVGVGTGGAASTAGTLALNQINMGSALLVVKTAPTLTSGFNTSGGSISANNGTAAFRVTVGTGAGTNTGVIGLPTAATGWNCYVENVTRAAQVTVTTSSASSVTVTNYGTTFTAGAFTNSDVLQFSCFAY